MITRIVSKERLRTPSTSSTDCNAHRKTHLSNPLTECKYIYSRQVRLPVAAAVALLLVAAGCTSRGGAGTSFLAAGFCVVAAATGTAISLSAFAATRHISRLLLWILIGCGFGFHIGYLVKSGELLTGLPTETIIQFEGTVKGEPVPLQGGRAYIRIEVKSCTDGVQEATASGQITVFLQDRPELSAGQYIRCRVKSLRSGEDGSWVCSAESKPQFLYWRSGLDRVRSLVYYSLWRMVESNARGEAEFLSAVLFGIREDPADPFVEKFRRAGVSHVLALSGMHLGIVAGFFLLLAKPFLPTGKAYLLTLPILGFYVWIVGLKPSLLRAAVMYLLASTRIVGSRKPESLSLLAIALACVLEIDPNSISSISFQLSFLALLGIMTVGSDLSGPLSAYLPRALALPLAMSIGAQIATAPVVAARFGTLYPIGIAATIVISPIIVVYLWAGLVFVLLSVLSLVTGWGLPYIILSEPVIRVMEHARRIIGFIVSTFAQIPGVEVGTGVALAAAGAFVLYLIWRVCIEYRYKRR